MSNIDKQALRDIAAAAVSTPLWHAVGVFGEVVDSANPEWKPVHDFCKTFTAERVLALLDELEAAERRIAELEARRAPDSFKIIGENIRTQDNRITSEPMFCVFQKREIVVDEDYDCDRIVWVDEEGCEATERKRMRLELLHDNCRETPDKWRRIAVKDIDDFVTCCFTEQGCKDYLACNGHNLRLPFIYVKSGFRNAEYIGIRNWLAGIGKGE
ncbi:ead/Ea22-like family protein [Enterobacter hormaechei]|uniref:ead/Ea22-like family protein n=1 Tax=Enterobacter hormaechei TaxID=158836 RepID=UPI0028742573|nr:ead/Ea22-like family protein [Enterobacter hormaechei]MDS0934533.1 ead/Ea22-like family protein [Enterobacter hormaechei]